MEAPDERVKGCIPGSLHIPLDYLRARFEELPRDKEIIAYCHSGQRSYCAQLIRILAHLEHGYLSPIGE